MAEKTFDNAAKFPDMRGTNTTSGTPTFGVADAVGMRVVPIYQKVRPEWAAQPPRAISPKGITANIVADLILDFCQEHGDLVTNLRLQRLLYFAQGWYLGLHGKKLYPEPLQAWASGPIQPDVYARFASFGALPISNASFKWRVPENVRSHIRELMEVYGSFSSFDLQRIACDEEPWREARKGLAHDAPSSNIIDTATLRRVYRGKAKQGKP